MQYAHVFDRWLAQAVTYERTWRTVNVTYLDYYDGSQWSDADRSIVEGRGQIAANLNVIRPTIDMILALEKERRLDLQIVPREDSDDLTARLLTELLKQVFDANDFDYYLSMCFRDAVLAGRGNIRLLLVKDTEGQDQVSVEYLPWHDCYLDPHHRRPDGSDARFVITLKWLDRDVAMKLWPEKAKEVDSTFNDDYVGQEWEAQFSSDGGRTSGTLYYNNQSDRICVFDCYYIGTDRKLHYAMWSDNVFFAGSPDDLNANKPPYDLTRFPVVTCFGFRDRLGRPQSLVAHLKDLQDMLNKTNSKLVWNMSANRLMYEDGAFMQSTEDVRDEWNRPDGVLKLETGGLAKVQREDNLRESQHLMSHMQFILGMVQRTSGINDSMSGLGGPNERSAQQQTQRIIQGTAIQNQLIDNIYLTRKCVARTALEFIGMYYTGKRVVRVTQPNGAANYYDLNPSAGVDAENKPLWGRAIRDIMRYDVTMKPVPPFTTARQNEFMTWGEVLKTGVIPPQIAAEILVALSDLPGKQDILYRLQQAVAAQQQAMAAQAPPT